MTNLVRTDGRFFVTEQSGRVMTFPREASPTEATVFLDIQDRVSDAGNEEGLLGLALDPAFARNGHFYIYYSADNPRRSLISRFTATVPNPTTAGLGSELIVMEIPQPFENHNGGQLAFGPDGMLYISLGDGGLGGDPQGNGQDLSTLLGSILRIDVSELGQDGKYRIPPDNPFVDVPDAKGEIWAYGFRNPWRFSFDRQSGDLWVGDVGQNSYEEVNLVVRGGNYGWNILEGAHCYASSAGCDGSGTILPVNEYGANKGCSVIGGYVYRGESIPSLAGTYLYADFCSGDIYGIRVDGGKVVEHELLVDSSLRITSFAEAENGEIYVLSLDGGIFEFLRAVP
ncbi:MAG: PQQ-dependent sugar dehydrogenase [SAR202 cluster bacterium]|nr:PQQ-dependent sugar dehydrogenase [SAR202 cluster bacterium]